MVVDVLCRASTQGGAESQMNTATTLTTDHDRTIIAHENECICLAGNFCDRETNQNGTGIREGASFTLNTVDRHGVAYDTGCLTPGEAQEQRCYSTDAPHRHCKAESAAADRENHLCRRKAKMCSRNT